MSNLVKTNNHFSHELFGSLTTITNDAGDVFFVGKEVATILGYTNISDAILKHVREKHRLELNRETLLSFGIDLGQRGGTLISEAGMYSLVMKSKLETAEKFQDWVSEEVLPTIRKTGTYGTAALPNFNDPYEAAIAWANEYKAKQESLTELGEVKNQLENVTIALDAHENWLSILAVSIANNISEKSLDWRKLKSKSAQMGYIIKTAPCPRFKMRNLYHIDVFRAVYPKLQLSGIRDMNILA
jgi:prophage antirepressor-like protein